jgi:hypothetical protein
MCQVSKSIFVVNMLLCMLTWMVLVKVDSVVMLTTGKTSTSGMFAVLSCSVERKWDVNILVDILCFTVVAIHS